LRRSRADEWSAGWLQIIGGYLEDRTPIAFARLVEREFGGLTPPPNL
jgi:amidase